MGRRTKLNFLLHHGGSIGFYLYEGILKSVIAFRNRGTDEQVIIRKFMKVFERKPDLSNPKTLNEKIQWLKLNKHEDFHTLCADKYTVRSYIRDTFGDEYLIPLFYETTDWRNISMDVIPDEPCIIKASHTQGDMLIIRDKKSLNIKTLRADCRAWLARNLYSETQEWQYKNCTPRIIIEKLLQTRDNHIPNDYKLHYFNGELKFVYCSIDREGNNKRNIYDANWKPLFFTWVGKKKDPTTQRGKEILAPQSFAKMKELGAVVAKHFDYVRVDFYDVDGKLYFGEITLHHGSGYDVFTPAELDLKYGEMLICTK